MKRRSLLLAGAAAVLTAAAGGVWVINDPHPAITETPDDGEPSAADRLVVKQLHEQYTFETVTDPDRTILRNHDGKPVAYLTHGARTVLFAGPRRVFAEPQATDATVTTNWWARIAPEAFRPSDLDAPAFAAWIARAVHDRTPDILAASMQYTTGAPELRDPDGVAYAGDAGFGYLNNETTHDGADFFDYLRVPWVWPDGSRSQPSSRWERELDCSGYLRLIYGYRGGITMYPDNGTESASGLPRSAYAMATRAQSVVIASHRRPSRVPTNLDRIQPGDLVFFALHDESPDVITHSGIVLGQDGDGRTRFVSARSTIDGPTMGDVAGDGVIEEGYFGDRLRRAIRL